MFEVLQALAKEDDEAQILFPSEDLQVTLHPGGFPNLGQRQKLCNQNSSWLYQAIPGSGVRAEFEGVVGIVNAEETKVLIKLTENSNKFIRRLPWANGYKEDNYIKIVLFKKIRQILQAYKVRYHDN